MSSLPPDETLKQLRKRLRREKLSTEPDLFIPDSTDFDETQLASGSSELINKTDAELFPDEIEEYMPKERRKKIVSDNTPHSER